MRLLHLHQRLRPYFARPEVYQHALLYLQAIMSDIPRKNGWQIAEHARQARPYGMQRLLSRAVWDEDGVRDELRALVCQSLHPPRPDARLCLTRAALAGAVIDESGFPKRGRHSAGVAPQYCGRTGRVENCQVGVFLSYVTALGHALIDRELYLPEDWCSDLPRRHAAHIPESVTFATKPELGQADGRACPDGGSAHRLGGGRYRLRPQPRLAPLPAKSKAMPTPGGSLHRSRLCADPSRLSAQ